MTWIDWVIAVTAGLCAGCAHSIGYAQARKAWRKIGYLEGQRDTLRSESDALDTFMARIHNGHDA